MRLLAILPALCMCAATILAIFCLLAGYNSTFLEGFELVTVNTSLLGIEVVDKVADGAISSAIASLPTAAAPIASAIVSEYATQTVELPAAATAIIPADIVEAINGHTLEDVLQNIAEELGIHDFYKLHMLNFCEGYYEPGPIPNATNPSPSQNITYCSPAQAFSFFNATQVLMDELNPAVPFDSLSFPSQVQDAITAMAVAQKAMFVLYCVGSGISGIAALLGLMAVLADGRFSAGCNSVLDVLAFLILGVSSALATAFIVIVVNAVDQYGAQVNVQAYKGTNFLIITWISTALALVASILWCVDCCAGPDRKYRNRRKSAKY